MKTSQNQYVLMVEYMEVNGDLSKPSSGPRGRLYVQKKWGELTELLNAEGTGIPRTEDKWRKVWSDFKNNTKKKYAKLHQYTNRTGGGPAMKDYLTDVEMRLMKITGSVVSTGMTQIKEAGFTKDISPNPTDQAMEEDPDDFIVVVEAENVDDTLGDQGPSNLHSNLKTPMRHTLGVQGPSNSYSNIKTPMRRRLDDQGPPNQLQANPVAQKTHTDLTQSVLAYQEKLLEYEKNRDQWTLHLEKQRIEIEAKRIEVERERVDVERDRVQQQAIFMDTFNKFFNVLNKVLEEKKKQE